jgi:hypothetical protein
MSKTVLLGYTLMKRIKQGAGVHPVSLCMSKAMLARLKDGAERPQARCPGCLLPLPQLPALLVAPDVPPSDGPKGPQRSSRPSRSAPALPGFLVARCRKDKKTICGQT